MREYLTCGDVMRPLADLPDAEVRAVLDRLSDDECATLLEGYEIEQQARRVAEAVVTVAAAFTDREDEP